MGQHGAGGSLHLHLLSALPPLDPPGHQTQGKPNRAGGNSADLASECGQALGTRTISPVSLPGPVDKRAPPAAQSQRQASLAHSENSSSLGE